MKDVLKIQLNKLYKEFMDNKKILDLKKIDCNLFRVEHKIPSLQYSPDIEMKNIQDKILNNLCEEIIEEIVFDL